MKRLYSWDDWFGSGEFSLVRGVDFSCSTWAMVQQIRSAASHRKLRIVIVENEDEHSISVIVVKEKHHAAHR